MRYLSIAAIAKNEHDYLLEFCAFHKVCGVEHITIYDNESVVPVKETLKSYINEGFVDVVEAPGRGIQMSTYVYACKENIDKTKWLALIDIDEYMVCMEPNVNDIKEILKDFDKPYIGSYSVSWRIFGAGSHLTKPNGLTIENFTMASPLNEFENRHCKAVCMPEKCLLEPAADPHHMRLKPNFLQVNERKIPTIGAFSPQFEGSKLKINHYVTRSLEEFQYKIQKGRIDTERHEGKKIEDFYRLSDPATEFDGCALRFVPAVKAEIERIL